MRVAVLSDVHANLTALDRVLAAAGDVDAVWHLGDVVGYGPDPDAVVERLAGIGARGVQGNHDAAAVGALDIDAFNHDARRAMEWTRARITSATADWLAALPVTREEGACTLVHGSIRDPLWEYILDHESIAGNLAALTTRVGLHGHTHVPVLHRFAPGLLRGRATRTVAPEPDERLALDEGPLLLNPGSVGQPRDGDPTASWLELDIDGDTLTATWRRVAYHVEAVQDRMRTAHLPPRLVDRLTIGV